MPKQEKNNNKTISKLKDYKTTLFFYIFPVKLCFLFHLFNLLKKKEIKKNIFFLE